MPPAVPLGGQARVSARRLVLGWGRLAWGLPALFAAAYVVVLIVDFRPVITSINLYGDAVIAPVLAKLLGQAPPGSHVVLGHHAYYEEFLFLRATSGVSFYRQLWEVAPLLWTLLGVAMLAWSARAALGGFAAIVTASALLCLGALGRLSFFTFDWHGLTAVHTILIGCVLVWLAPRAAVVRWRSVVALGAAVGLISALPVASDLLFVVWALIPMVIAAVLISLRGVGRGRLTPIVFVVITVVVSALVGVGIDHVMRADGVTASHLTSTFVSSSSAALHNLGVLFEGFLALGGGYFFGMKLHLLGALVFLSGVLIVAAIVLGLLEVRRLAVIWNRASSRAPAPTSTVAYVGFWASSLILQSAVFVLTSIPKGTTASSRYVLAGYVAIIALVPLLARRGKRWRAAVAAGVCLFALSGVVQLARKPFASFGPYPTPTAADRVLRFARAHDVQYGYAGYWDAPDLTWLTRFRLKIYPITAGCGSNGLCAISPAQINTWYRPRSGVRSMLIADRALPGVSGLDPKLGPPLATTRIGTMTVAVYPFDIASRFSGT